ncbi:MAG: class E sortase, partial [Acidobacteria bacterium]|nr:class E sortase [Acidobacteriota bacterium]
MSSSIAERPSAPTPLRRTRRTRRSELPPLSQRQQLVRIVMLMVLAASAGMVLHLAVVSGLQHAATQRNAFERFRGDLAAGTVAIGPTDDSGSPVALGTSLAYLEIPRLDLHEVVRLGTTPGVLFGGPGLRRDTPLPGQVGTSVILGRRAAYGGPFADLDELRAGDAVTVTTGQGVFQFEVIGTRRAGDPVPPALAKGKARLSLVTADGSPFVPSGLFRADADLVGDATGGMRPAVPVGALPAAEQPLGTDSSTLWALALWLQALIVVSVAAVWAW